MRVTLPADYASAISEVGGIAALLDKNGWKAAAFLACYVKPGAGHGGRKLADQRVSVVKFARDLKAKGWSENVIRRHYDAWEAAHEAGVVQHAAADLVAGERIELPDTGWSEWYPSPTEADSRYQIEDKDEILAEAVADGLTGSKAVDIAKNTKSMAAAIKASPKVAAAAAQALVDKGDIDVLSKATASVAQNRQVERNRRRASLGEPRERGVNGAKDRGLTSDPGVSAFMSVKGLSDALRALVTTFPKEWAELSDAAREDEDFRQMCEESLDKIEIAVANARLLVSGGVSDADLHKMLDGAS